MLPFQSSVPVIPPLAHITEALALATEPVAIPPCGTRFCYMGKRQEERVICLTQIHFARPVNTLLYTAGPSVAGRSWRLGHTAHECVGVREAGLLGLPSPLALADHMTTEGLLGPKRICFPPALSGSTWVWDSHHLTYWKRKGRSFHKGINECRRKPPPPPQ